MASVNKVIIVGNLGGDPEIRYTQSGICCANFSVATAERWTDKSNTKKEKTEWHKIVAWDRLGEICGEYLKKGSQVYLEGRLQTRKWEDRDGNPRYTTEVVAFVMQMLGSKPRKEEQQGTMRFTDGPGNNTTIPEEDMPF